MTYSFIFAGRTLFLAGIITSALAADLTTQTVLWSTKTYGPNGPWQAVTIEIGDPPQAVDLLPGGYWASNVLTPSICLGRTETECAIPKAAGFYDENLSKTSKHIVGTGRIANSTPPQNGGVLDSLQGNANYTFDTVKISMLDVGQPTRYSLAMRNFSMLTITSGMEELPDGTTYPAQIGK